MTKPKQWTLIAGVTLFSLLIGVRLVFGAPAYSIQPSILPLSNDKYFLGSTSPNLQWSGIYTKDLVVTGTCIGCGGGDTSGLVPYTGATSDVDLGNYSISANGVYASRVYSSLIGSEAGDTNITSPDSNIQITPGAGFTTYFSTGGLTIASSTHITPSAGFGILVGEDNGDNDGVTIPVWYDKNGLAYNLVGGGGGCTTLDCLSDALVTGYTSGQVLRADGAQFTNSFLDFGDLTGYATTTQGGTGFTSYTAGDLLYASDATNLAKLGIGSTGKFLTVSGGIPAWGDAVDLTSGQTIGGTKIFSSFPQVSGTPVNGNDLVNKTYADGMAAGFKYKDPAKAATTTNLTLSGVQTIDGYSASASDRILVMGQSSDADNGCYTEAAGAWSRCTDYDTAGEVTQGTVFLVLNGNFNGSRQFAMNSANVSNLGADPITFTQVSAPPSYTANNGVQLNGSTFSANLLSNGGLYTSSNGLGVLHDNTTLSTSTGVLAIKNGGVDLTTKVSGVLPFGNGGTGQSSYTDGQLLIGNSGTGGLSKATLTAGANVTIANGNGSIVISSTGGGGGGGASATTTNTLYFVSAPVQGWTRMPAALTEIFASTAFRERADITYATQYRIGVNQTIAGYTNATLNLQYSTDGTTYQAADTGSAGAINVGTGIGVKYGNWTNLVAGAKSDVWLRLVGQNGNASANPQWNQIWVEFRYPVGGGLSIGGSDKQVQFNQGGNLAGSSSFVWDYANTRLGIGTSSPYSTLAVVGQAVASYFTATSTTATSTFASGIKGWPGSPFFVNSNDDAKQSAVETLTFSNISTPVVVTTPTTDIKSGSAFTITPGDSAATVQTAAQAVLGSGNVTVTGSTNPIIPTSGNYNDPSTTVSNTNWTAQGGASGLPDATSKATRQPTAPSTTKYADCTSATSITCYARMTNSSFTMPAGAVATDITVWEYGEQGGSFNYLNLKVNGTIQATTTAALGSPGSPTWVSATYSGFSLTQAQLDAVEAIIAGTTGGSLHNKVYAVYFDITYNGPISNGTYTFTFANRLANYNIAPFTTNKPASTTVAFTTTGSGRQPIYFNDTSHYISHDGGAYFGGWVGIGTTSPNANLTIDQSSDTASNGLSIVNSAGTSNGTLFNSGTALVLQEGNTNTMFIDGGKVGIGTSTPAYQLDVRGYAKWGGTVANLNGATTFPYLPNTGQALWAWNQSAGGGEQNIISNRGAGGVGGFRFSDYQNDGTFTDILTMQGGGNVGIGTTTPRGRLHITAGANATTTVTLGELGISTSKACFNTKNTAGGGISFYFVGTTMVVENNLCK